MPYDTKRSNRTEAHAGEAARVGEELRDARAALGYSIEEMAAALRINRRYLSALEEGRVRDLPGAAYALGFVRSYAGALGLNADELVRRFRESSAAAARGKSDLVFPEPVPDRGVPAGAIVLFGVLIAIGGYVLWWQSNGTDTRAVDVVPPLPPALDRAAELGMAQLPGPAVTATPPNGPRPANGADAMPGGPPTPALPPPAAGVEPGRLALPRAEPPPMPEVSASGIPFPAPPPPAAPSSPAPPAASAPPAAAAAALAPSAAGTRIVLRATQAAWIQVRDPRSGQVLANQTLRPGETWEVPPDRPGLLLDTGRAEGLAIELDGRSAPVLAGRTGVLRGVVLDPDRLAAPN